MQPNLHSLAEWNGLPVRKENGLPSPTVIVVPDFPPLPTHYDALTAQSIEAEYNVIQKERKTVFEEARRKIREEPRLKPLLQKKLTEFGCPEVFARIALCVDSDPRRKSALEAFEAMPEDERQKIYDLFARRTGTAGEASQP